MGVYTSATKVRQLSPTLNDLPRLTDDQISFYVNIAEAEINVMIANRYTLPFSSTPALLEAVATEYASIKLMDRFFTSDAPKANEWKTERKKDLKELLKGIADGSISLVNSSYGMESQNISSLIEHNNDSYNPIFNLLDPALQQNDSDRIEAEFDDLK